MLVRRFWDKTMSKFRAAIIILAACLSTPSQAEVAFVYTKVNKILATEQDFGGCMIQLTNSPQSVLPNCKPNWVTLSCDGTFMSIPTAQRLFEQAQLGWLLGNTLTVYIDDSRTINGYCVANRIDLTK